MKPIYAIVLVDTHKEAFELNKEYKPLTSAQCKMQAVYVGEVVHGRQYRGHRINMVIDCTKVRPSNFEWWNRIKRGFDRDVKYI